MNKKETSTRVANKKQEPPYAEGTYGGVRGGKTKVGRKPLRFLPA